MCDVCRAWSRRRVLGALSATAASMLIGVGARAAAISPDEAVERLKAGNRNYVAGPQLCVTNLAKTREKVATSQSPWATILSCADSRVAPELIFGGVGQGELFVARNAGNIADTDVLGTIEYGAEHLHSPLVVVLGHERCGAVTAACDVVTKGANFPGSIGKMVSAITAAVQAVEGKPGDLVDLAIREHARRNAQSIRDNSQIVAELERAGKLKVLHAYYDLDTGVVDFLG